MDTIDDDMRARLLAVLVGLEDRLVPQELGWGREYVANGAFELALDRIADWLSGAAAPLTDDERHELMVLAARLNMVGWARRALSRCPRMVEVSADLSIVS